MIRDALKDLSRRTFLKGTAGAALGGAAIDAAGVSGPFVLSCGAAGVTALLALRARERPTPVAG